MSAPRRLRGGPAPGPRAPGSAPRPPRPRILPRLVPGALLGALLAGCGSEADHSRLPAIPQPPVVPPLDDVVATGESRRFDLDLPGGGSGAPFGANLFVPPGAQGSARAGLLSDGSRGAELSVPAAFDTVMCTTPVPSSGSFDVTARLRVAELVAPAVVELELRPRDAAGALVSPPGSRFVRLSTWSAPGDWVDWSGRATLPEGATKAELCLRFVGGAGRVEVDALGLVTPGVPLPPVVPAVTRRWELDEPGGEREAPLGFAFLVPPGTVGAELRAGERAGARGVWLRVSQPGNAVVCSEGFVSATGMVGRGRVVVEAVTSDERPWTGFVAEVRTYDLVGGLVSPGGGPFTQLHTWKAPTPGEDFAVAFAPPSEAATAKLCFRFVEATGVAFVDWAGVGGAGDGP